MIIKLQDLKTISMQDVNAAILRNDPAELELVSITVALSDLDIYFIQSICVGLTTHSDSIVRGNALVSLGHLARRYFMLDELSIKTLIESALLDSHDYVRLCAKSAADEIHQFLHWDIRGHVYG
jgi:hypothetical protein